MKSTYKITFKDGFYFLYKRKWSFLLFSEPWIYLKLSTSKQELETYMQDIDGKEKTIDYYDENGNKVL